MYLWYFISTKGIKLLWYFLLYVLKHTLLGESISFVTFFISEYGHSHAKAIISVNFTCRNAESKHTCISRIVVIATTNEERIVSAHEVSPIV